jgi:LEA14-like dessication related protein
MIRTLALIAAGLIALAGCASMPQTDPPNVTVVDIEPVAGEGLEARMLLKLRVQNPNNTPIEFSGVYVDIKVLGKSFASGVSDERGTVPSFGETVIDVPVTMSVIQMVGHALEIFSGKAPEKITYEMSGKLNSTTSGTLRFKSQGEMALPAGDT